MSELLDISREYTFSPPIDITATLDRLGIEYLDVRDRRAIVIFTESLLNIEGDTDPLTELERVEITVYDLSLDRERRADNETEAAIELIEDFVDRLPASEPIA